MDTEKTDADRSGKGGKIRKAVLVPAGCIFLAIGGVGIALPVLPTTPFVLLAAGCFATSSPGMYDKLANSKYFGEYVRNYKEKTGISTRTRAISLIFLWCMLGISAFFMKDNTTVLCILLIVGIAVSVHILTIRRASAPQEIKEIS